MIALNNGEYSIELEAELEILMADVAELPASADEAIDMFLEVRAAELPGVEA